MVDIRDIATIAVLAILDKEAVGHDPVVELVGPDNITGTRAAEIWSEVTGRAVTYGSDDIGIVSKSGRPVKCPDGRRTISSRCSAAANVRG